MKILFVLSGNKDKSSGLVVNQAESIISYDKSVEIDYYYVKGKGVGGYLKNVSPLRKNIKELNPDIIHAHYSLCGFLSVLSLTKKPIITSLMGSDLHLKMHWRVILFIFSMFWKAVIVKSSTMQKKYLLPKTYVIPNGVDFSKYAELSKTEARELLNISSDKTIALFLADPERPEKNFQLASDAFNLLNHTNAELLVIHNIPHEKTKLYYYAADVLLLSSVYEGSPNVIKEAMVCNCPIVSTNVGDVKMLFDGVEGNFIADNCSDDFSKKLKLAIEFSKEKNRTLGKNRISALGIDSDSIAKKIISIYRPLTV